MGQVNVTISGKTYRMACDDGQEAHLSGLGDQLSETIELLRRQFGEIGDQRLTVMAAITLADRYSESEHRIGALEAEVARLRDESEAEIAGLRAQRDAEGDRAESRETVLTDTLDSIAGRLEALADRLNGSDPLGTH